MTLTVFLIAALLATGESASQGNNRRRSPQSSQQTGSSHLVDFDCPEEFGYYAHPTDCTQYYVCVFGGALLESCTGGLMYSHELQTCDWPRNVGCAPGSDGSVQAIQQHQTEERPPLRQTQSERSRTQSRIQTQQIPKHDLYTEEEPLPEELDPDRQQRVYRGQPQTIGQVQSDRDGLSTHSNAIPVPSGGRDKLSVVSYGSQQQYTSDNQLDKIDFKQTSSRLSRIKRQTLLRSPPDGRRHPFDDRPVSWSSFQPRILNTRRPPHFLPPAPPPGPSLTSPPPNNFARRPIDFRFELSDARASPRPTSIIPHITVHASYTAPPFTGSFPTTYSVTPSTQTSSRLETLRPPPPTTQVFSYSERPSVHRFTPNPRPPPPSQSPRPPNQEEESEEYDEDYDEDYEDEDNSDENASGSSEDFKPFPGPLPPNHRPRSKDYFDKFLEDLKSEMVDPSKTTPRPVEQTTKRFRLSEMYRPSTTTEPSADSEEYYDSGEEYDEYDDYEDSTNSTSRPKAPKVPKRLQNISNQAESDEGSYEDDDEYYDSSEEEEDSDEDTEPPPPRPSSTSPLPSSSPRYTVPPKCLKGRCPPKPSTRTRPTSKPLAQSTRPLPSTVSESKRPSSVLATTTTTPVISSNLTGTRHKKLRQSPPRYVNGKKLMTSGGNLLSMTKNTNNMDKGQTHRAVNAIRGNVSPQQTYIEQQSTTPTRAYNQSRYVPSQYDPPPFYSLYDEDVDLFKETGDYAQYNSQSNGQYRGQTVSYKDKKPQIEIVQQEPVQRNSAYAKNKYNAQSDIYQSVTPQEYDSYSIQTNDDIPYRQTQQKPRYEVKEASGKMDVNAAKMAVQQTLDSTTQITIPTPSSSPTPQPTLILPAVGNTPRPFSLPDPEPVSLTRSDFTVGESEPIVTPRARQLDETRGRHIAIRVPQASIDSNRHEERGRVHRPTPKTPIRAPESAEWLGFHGESNLQDSSRARGRSRYHESAYELDEFQDARNQEDEARKKANEQARLRQIELAEEEAKEEVSRRRAAQRAEEEKRKQDAESRRKQAEEAARMKQEEETRKKQEEAERRELAELEKLREIEEEMLARRKEIEEYEYRAAVEAARKKDLEENERKAAEAARRQREELRRAAAEEARRQAAIEAARKKEAEEAERRAVEAAKKKQLEEAALKEARRRQELEERAALEAARRREAEEAERRARKKAEEDIRRQQAEENERRSIVDAAKRRQAVEEAQRRALVDEAKRKQEAQRHVALSREEAEHRARQELALRPTDARRKLADRSDDPTTAFRVVVPQSLSTDSRPPKKFRNATLVNEPYLTEQSTPFYPTPSSDTPARTYTDSARKTLDTPIPISKVNSENEKNSRGRPTSYESQSTPGSSSRGNARHRGSQTYTVSPNEAEPAPASRGNSASSRGRPTLKPSTTVVGKASEFIDIYRYPAQRPANIYPTPQVDKTAAKCRKDVCLLPDCSCGGKDVPGDLPLEETPQIVLLTFDDSVNDLNKQLYSDLFEKGRVNPNGCPISATFYVSHEWTDYSQVQNLYSTGHEIASHSVSHSFGEQFSVKKWTREISGQREILAAYGGVRMEDIRGMRAPFLAVGGNKMFKMLYDSNFTYDSSMPVYENKPPSWPYTMDYKIFHDCMIPPCPSRSYPGVWEVPMVMWQDLNGGRCSMGDACSNPPNAEGVYKMLVKNFERHFTSNRAPFGLFYHAAWFTQPHHKEGFIAFLDTINKMPEVWIVTNWQAIQWVRDPTPISRLNNFAPFQCNYPERPKKCNNPKVCNLWHKSGVRYMRTCQPCPEVYPWTGNSGVRNSRVDNEIINE